MIAKFRHWTGWIEGRKKKRKRGKKWHEYSQKRGRERERRRRSRKTEGMEENVRELQKAQRRKEEVRLG